MNFQSINPATGEKIDEFTKWEGERLEKALQDAHNAFSVWKRAPFVARAQKLNQLADILVQRKTDLARTMTLEMGKPLTQAEKEIEKCGLVCRFYAENAEEFLRTKKQMVSGNIAEVQMAPIGLVFAIMPWNFPFWQVVRFAAPAMMAGNAVLLKHAPNTIGCALEIEKLFKEVGFEKGVFQTLLIDHEQTSEVIADPRIRAVTFTGSDRGGQAVAEQAGRFLKKTVLELGGSDPYVVLRDADLKKTVKACVQSRMINSGQSCVAAKRFIIEEAIFEEFEELFLQEMKVFQPGDPLSYETNLGPLARADLRASLHQQVIESEARLLLGGKIPEGLGSFYPATVLSDVRPGMRVFDEETFGPVSALIRAKDEKEALRLANLSRYGLGGAVFSEDLEKARRLIEDLECGTCSVNTFVQSDPQIPFGGVKDSGYGRELSRFGILEFVNIKSIVFDRS
jgi:succinate-semialdehyde dehydrogenase / glutarate-semialdehyde dehydrogenase